MNFGRTSSLILGAGLILLALSIAACGGGDEEPTPFPTPTSLPEVAAPAEEAAAEAAASATEAPESQPESPLSPLPTPTSMATGIEVASGRSAVVGIAINQETGEPFIAKDIRLAEVYCPDNVVTPPEEKNEKCAWALDDAQSPYTQTTADGSFRFLDVEARDYVLLMQSSTGEFMPASGDDGRAFIYTPEAGDVLEVGVVELVLVR